MRALHCILLTILFSVYFSVLAVAQWVQMSGPTGGDVRACVMSGNTLITGTYGGGVFVSYDFGINWVAANNGLTDKNILSLAADDTIIFAGTANGGVFRSTDQGNNWIPIGPSVWDKQVNALSFNGTTIFAGTKSGVIYSSSNNGLSWTEKDLHSNSVFSLFIKGSTVYAGTYEDLFRSTDSGLSWYPADNFNSGGVYSIAGRGSNVYVGTYDGIYYSTNDTDNWKKITTPFNTNYGVHPLVLNDSSIYAGTYEELYCSNDEGLHWTRLGPKHIYIQTLLSVDNTIFSGTKTGIYLSRNNGLDWQASNTGLKSTSIRSIVGEDTNLFAACNAGIYHSSDSGTNWKIINNGLTNTEINTLLKKDGSLFAGSNIRYNEPSSAKFPAGVFSSSDGGENWITSNTGLPERSSIVSIITIDSIILISAQTEGGNNGVYMSVDNAKSWVLTGFGNGLVYNLYKAGSNLFAGTFDKIFKSSDNGINWSEVSGGLTAHYVRTFIHNDNYIFAGTDDGIYRSSDTGKSWIQIGLANTTIASLAFRHDTLYAGSYQKGVYKSADGGLTWLSLNNGIKNKDIYALLVADSILYAGSYLDGVYSLNDTNWELTSPDLNNKYVTSLVMYNKTLYAGTGSGVYRSQNNVSNWVSVNNGLKSVWGRAIAVSDTVIYFGTTFYLIPPDSGSSDGGVFISRNNGSEWFESNSGLSDSVTGSVMGFVPLGDSTLFASTYRNGVSRSTDNGSHWVQPGNSELSNKMVTAMTIYDSDLFVGTEFNGVYRSLDLGNSWSQSNSGLVSQKILSLYTTSDGIFVSTESGLNYSTDGGNYWNSWNHGLPAAVLCFEENSPVLFVGTEGKGVYRSINNGISWIKISDGLTDSTINDLHVGGTYLYAAVEGAGIWRRSLSEITSSVKPNGRNISKAVSLDHSFPNPCGVATNISFSIPKLSRPNLIVHDVFGKVVAVLLDEELEQGNYSVHFETINLPNGVYFYSLQVGDVWLTRQLLVSK